MNVPHRGIVQIVKLINMCACNSNQPVFNRFNTYVTNPSNIPVLGACVYTKVEIEAKLNSLVPTAPNFIGASAILKSAIAFYDKDCNKFSANIASLQI